MTGRWGNLLRRLGLRKESSPLTPGQRESEQALARHDAERERAQFQARVNDARGPQW